MPVSSSVHTNITSRGATYKVSWSTEASQQVAALYSDDRTAGVENPVNPIAIIRAIRRSPNDSLAVQPEIGTETLGVFLVENEGVAYEVLVSYHPALVSGGNNVCEIGGVTVCSDPDLLAALKQGALPSYSTTLQNGPTTKKELASAARRG